MADYGQTDAMIARLEGELEERNAFIQGVIGGAQNADRDLSDNEKELLTSARTRVEALRSQLDTLQDSRETVLRARERSAQLHRDMVAGRRSVDKGEIEYRSAGAYIVDLYKAAMNDKEAADRLALYTRAADHLKTGDLEGAIPDPIVGSVLNFIDSARPLVSAVGARPMPSAIWHRPKVTQRPAVGPQGTAGGAGDEKSELVSQKLILSRLTAEAVTYGGYLNVSRQSIDFGTGTIDLVVNGLAAEYAVETEAAFGAELSKTTASEGYGTSPTDATVRAAIWAAVAKVYAAVKGQGRLILAVAPDRLEVFGNLFGEYVNPQNAASPGFQAGQFGQGVMGQISGVPVVMSAGLAAGESFLFSTAAVEAYEQRVGTLQVTEPSVLGTQVGYAGYFTPMTVESAGVVELTATA